MSVSDNLARLPLLPRDDEGPVFTEPWQAQAFAVVVELIQSGRLTHQEWAGRLGKAFRAAEERGEQHTGERYYQYWLAALENLAVEKQLTGWDDLAAERETIEAEDQHRREEQISGHHHHH
jgi:nitrile hydratase accessory protein